MSSRKILSALFAVCVLTGLISSAEAAPLKIADLRCEYRTNPLGIDAALPRLGWKLESKERGVRQTAYQVLVASSPKLLKENPAKRNLSPRAVTSNSFHPLFSTGCGSGRFLFNPTMRRCILILSFMRSLSPLFWLSLSTCLSCCP